MVKYRISFSNNLNEDYVIDLDNKDYIGDITHLTGTGEVLSMRSIGDDDDRFSPINSKEYELSIWIPEIQNVSIGSFLATEDDQWRVIIHREMSLPPIFDGFMVVEDSSEPMHDRPYPLNIRASDGIPLLKNVPLKHADGTEFRNLNTLTDYIGHVLYYINPNIPFRIYTDVYHKNMDTSICAFEQMKVDTLTFKKDKNTFLDGYAVLEKILLSTSCRLFYENGYWHIVNIYQYKNSVGFNWHEYKVVNDAVTHQGFLNNDTLIAKIGKREVINAINKDAIIYYKVPFKSVKKTFNYEIPSELICNQELQEGTKLPLLSTPASGTPNTSGYVPATDTYTAECYFSSRSPTAVLSTTEEIYIKTQLDAFGYEIDRFLILPRENNNVNSYIHTDDFPVNKDDQVSFSIDVRIKNNYGGTLSTSAIYLVYLTADDGTVWSLGTDFTPGSPTAGQFMWFQTPNANFVQGPGVTLAGDQKIEWTTVTATPFNKIPKDGRVHLILIETTGLSGSTTNETWFKNIQITYEPYIKNSYRPATGDFNIHSQNRKINRTIEEDVYISDSPKKIIKGALFVNDLLATPEWFRLGRNESLRFMQLMTLLKYNFHFRQFRKVEGTLKGLSLFNVSDTNIPFGFLPQYSLSDVPNSPRYILTSITECNYVTGQWRGVIVEIPTDEPQFDVYDFQYMFK